MGKKWQNQKAPQQHHGGGAAKADQGPKWCPGCRQKKAEWSYNQRSKPNGKCVACIAAQQGALPAQREPGQKKKGFANDDGLQRVVTLGPLKDPRWKAIFDLINAANPAVVVKINDIFTNKLDANKDGYLTYVDFHACPAMWEYLITMGFDNNRDLKISVNEFGYKFIELALVQPMPIAGFNGTGLQLYEEFINEVSKRVEAQVTRLASVIDEMVAAMAARSQEIARAAFEQANMNGVAFQPQQFAAAGPFDQQHHNVFNYPGV